MKYLSIPVTDAAFEKFTVIQKKYNFKNQSDAMEYVIEQAAAKEEASQQ